MSVFFTSDLHLGHENSAKRRGFSSAKEHDDAVIESLSKACYKKSLLYILGDVALEDKAIERIKEIPGRKRIILGNHDYSAQHYSKVAEYVGGFIKYKNMWLSHCPIHPQEMFRCVANVHGHIHHGGMTESIGFPYINVNWDIWHRPLTLDEVKEVCDANIQVQ